MSPVNASASGQFRIGDITVNRLGYGAMRITGPGIWGAPADRHSALATLRRVPEIGVNFEFTRINIELIILYKKIEDLRQLRADT